MTGNEREPVGLVPRTWTWSPASMFEEVERMLNDMRMGLVLPGNSVYRRDGARMPNVDLKEEGDRFLVQAELPGMSKEDVTIETDGDLLSIAASKEQEIEENKQHRELDEKRRLAEEESARIRAEEERAQKEAEEIETQKLEEQRQAALEMEKLAENLAAAAAWIEEDNDPPARQKPAAMAKDAADQDEGKSARRGAASPPSPPPSSDDDDSDLEIELRRLILLDFKKNK